jgi:surface antigen
MHVASPSSMKTLRNSTLTFLWFSLASLSSCAPPGAELDELVDDEEAGDTDAALDAPQVAQLALDNLGNTACGTNSLGGKGFYTSCTGNGGYPEYWCSDFAKWVWKSAGAKVTGLTPAAGSFYCYGQNNGTLSNTPHVGDAVVYNYQGNCWADHVAIVSKVNPDGSIETVSGNWGGQSGSQAHFSSTSSVKLNKPAYSGTVGAYSNTMGMKISGFISPAGLPVAAPPPAPPPPPEGSQAFVTPKQQHYFRRDQAGNVRHLFWDGNQNNLLADTWGTGAASTPVTFKHGTSQHAFARKTDGSLGHWFWDPVNGLRNDSWAPAGSLAGAPAALVIGDFEAVWGVDSAGKLQHWYWGPSTGGVKSDTWGSGVVGRPSVFLTKNGEQHAFARGTGGTVEHFFWTPNGTAGVQHDTWGTGLVSDPAALAIGEFQAVWGVDSAGKLQHWYWGPNTGGVKSDTWGSGVVGRPSVFLTKNGEQHAFARGTGGTVEHWWWTPNDAGGIRHDTWGSGITEDPTAALIGEQQHVWAAGSNGNTLHWFWDPATSSIQQDNWGK